MAEVLVLSNPTGSSAREHSLAWKISQSPDVSNVFVAPGNAGIKNSLPDLQNIEDCIRFAKERNIALTVVGPEALLAQGVVDMFEAEGLPIFGPRKHVAQIETSKTWCYNLSVAEGVPFAHSFAFYAKEEELAKQKIRELGVENVVIKVDGLADGKGVTLFDNEEDAFAEVDAIMAGKYKNGGKNLQIQLRLKGQELSVFTLSDGENIQMMLKTFRDYKLLNGLNTGGMGGFGPVPITRVLLNQIEEQIVKPTIRGLKKEGGFRGVLYTGIMLTGGGPVVFEQNARFGDPECQLLMPLLDCDLYKVLHSCTNGTLSSQKLNYFYGFTTGVVLAAEGYPSSPISDDQIYGLNKTFDQDLHIFHYQTRGLNGEILTHGGRELIVVGYDTHSLRASRDIAYSIIGPQGIHFRGMQFREDIAD